MAAMLDLPVTTTSESIHTSIIVLLDPENVGVAIGISLPSYIQAEIYDIAYVLPVLGGHRRVSTGLPLCYGTSKMGYPSEIW